jgi:two-component system phosphate regulon sensor histidine kinase PhoR
MGISAIFALLFLAVSLSAAFRGQFAEQMKDSLKTLRFSLIDPGGKVIFDNFADPGGLGSHKDRAEVLGAMQKGEGGDSRLSETLGKVTHYYATSLPDGNILRLAITADVIDKMAEKFIPALAGCLLLAVFVSFALSRWLTGKIVGEINNIDLEAEEIDTYDELLPFLRKIAAQKKEIDGHFAALKTQTAIWRAVTENMREGLLIVDGKSLVVMANKSVAGLFGETDPCGKNVIELCRDADFLEKLKTCLSGQETQAVLRQGRKIHNVFLNPIREGENRGGAAVLFVDTTKWHEAEEQRKEFSANVSHELKTPLTTISALSEMIADRTANEEDARVFAQKIRAQAKRLIDIIEDIIMIAEFDEGGTAGEHTSFDLCALAEEVAAGLREKALLRNVSVSVKERGPLYITAGRNMVDRLLYNLIDNAVKYNRDGGRVDIALSEEGEFCRMAVADTGIGIPAQHIDHIFERFYRADKSRSKKTGGAGLGLSIVKHIVEAHKGRIAVESAENEGTSVTCFIPKNSGGKKI